MTEHEREPLARRPAHPGWTLRSSCAAIALGSSLLALEERTWATPAYEAAFELIPPTAAALIWIVSGVAGVVSLGGYIPGWLRYTANLALIGMYVVVASGVMYETISNPASASAAIGTAIVWATLAWHGLARLWGDFE